MKYLQLFTSKKISTIYLSVILSFVFVSANAQARFGFKTALGLKLNKQESVLHSSDGIRYTDRISFQGESATQSLGLFFRTQSNFLFLETDVMFSTFSSSFGIEDLTLDQTGVSDIPGQVTEALQMINYTDVYSNIDFSVLAGYTYNKFDFGLGPIFHRTISLKSELSQVEGYKSNRKLIDPGFQFKIGYNFGPLNIGVKYEDYFLRASDHFTLDNKKLKMKSGLNTLKLELALGF